MFYNTSKNLPGHHRTIDSLANSTATIYSGTGTADESGSRDIIGNDPVVNSGRSNQHETSLVTGLNNNAIPAIDTISSGNGAMDAGCALTTQDELVQRICDAADMACKAKRVNQLISYVSGIDYSMAQDSAYEPAGGGPKKAPGKARKETTVK